MARTTAAAVGKIIEVDSNISLSGFIDTAGVLVDAIQENDSSGLLSAKDLEVIERWLTAHFYAHRDQLYATKQTGKASATFQGKTAMRLDSTQYGQTAKLLDRTGYLAGLDEKKGSTTVGLTWLGKEYEDEGI